MYYLKRTLSYKAFYPIFFISGVCSLAYELIWIKMFIPIFGMGLYSVSAVVSSFMGGLTLGSYICGKIIDHKKNLLLYYACFEFFIGIYSAILPFLLKINHGTMPFFYNNISSNFYIYSIFRFIFAFLLLIVPCSLIGATLPLMSRFLLTASNRDIKKDFSLLYAINTFGAVCGCIIVTFFLLERLGITQSSYIFAIINIFIAIHVYLYSLSYKSDKPVEALVGTQETPVLSKTSPALRNALFLSFLCGFCALSFEILLLRVLIGFLPNNVYLFPIILIITLTATALGSFLNSVWFTKIKHYLCLASVLMVITGFTLAATLCYVPLPLLEKLNYLHWPMYQYVLLVCLSMVFPTSLLMGIIFPNLVASYSGGVKSIGHDVGSIYSINTFGGMLGSFFTSFIFIPFLGLRNSFFYCLAVYILSAGYIILAGSKKIGAIRILMPAIAISAVLLLNKLVPINLFKDIFTKNMPKQGELLFYKEGVVSSLGVIKQKNRFFINYSDKTGISAGTSQTDLSRSNHRLKAHIPIILHKDPRTIVNIGFGTGISAYSLTLHDIDRIDNVEICAETMEVTKFFVEDPKNIFNNPKVSLVIDDGRNFLFVTKMKYDNILIYPFNPLLGENIFFYTKDFLELCKTKLKPGGLISLWFPVGRIKTTQSLILLKTFLEVFPYSALFSTLPVSSYTDIKAGGMLIGSSTENGLNLSAAYLEKRFLTLKQAVRIELTQSGINNTEDLLKRQVLNTGGLMKLCGSVKELITDDKTILDYERARKVYLERRDSRDPDLQ